MKKCPAPDEVLEFTTCACKKTNCATNQCQCFALNLECMDRCTCRSCSNKNEMENQEVTIRKLIQTRKLTGKTVIRTRMIVSCSESHLEVDELYKFVLK